MAPRSSYTNVMPPSRSFPSCAQSKQTTAPSSLLSHNALWVRMRRNTQHSSFRLDLRPTSARSPTYAANTKP
eukprot:2494145-Pleurochrysis_carterae.AAC.1